MRISKKLIFPAILCFVICSQLFGYQTKARIVFSSDLFNTTIKSGTDQAFNFFTLNQTAQINDDGIVVECSEENFGARLGFLYNVDSNTASGLSNLSFRRSLLWFSPMDQLKITVGYVGNDQLFKERITNWKVGSPFAYNSRNWSAHPGYVNCSDVDELGFGIEVEPISGFIVTAAVARPWGTPGNVSNPFIDIANGNFKMNAWGVTGRYYYSDFCFQAAYRDNGSDDWKVARCAVGYEANGFYGFFQSVFGIDWDNVSKTYSLSGLCFDMYGEYRFDSWTLCAHVPVTVRFSGAVNDPCYLEWETVAKYNFGLIENMDSFCVYGKLGSIAHDGDNSYAMYRLNNDFIDSLNIDAKLGISFSVGACSVDSGINVLVPSKITPAAKSGVKINVPLSASLKF